jgi:ABC-type oligopeptide transport system substrate-binding subunit
MRKKRSLWIGAVLILALAVAATAMAGSASSQKKVVLKMTLGAEPPSLDPGLATDTTSASVLDNIMDPLIKLGPSPALKPGPGLVQSWKVSGTNVTLNVRHDDKWTNGKPVTANDIVQSWLRTISPQLAADYAYQFYGIVGAEAYNSCDPSKANCDALKAKVGVSAPNKWTVKVKLVSPQPWFIQQLSHTSFLPVYMPAVQKYGNKWTEAANIVTDGPFKLASWKHDASLKLVKNPKWRDAANVHVDEIDMPIITDAGTALNAFNAGNVSIDTTGFNPTDIPKLKKTKFWKSFTTLGTYYYGFNVKEIPDVNQRRAMAAAIDRHAIIKYITQSGQVPAKAFTPITIAGGTTIDKDAWLPPAGIDTPAGLAKVQSLMAKVKNPVKNVTLFVNNSPGHAEIAQAVQGFWSKMGIHTTIKVMDWKQYLQFLGPPPDASVDVYRLGWLADYPDAYNFLSLWTCKSGNNNTNWCNAKFDAIINKALHTPDNDKRTALYQQAEDLLTGPNGDMPVAPIYWYTQNYVVKTNVHGFYVDPMGIMWLSGITIG